MGAGVEAGNCPPPDGTVKCVGVSLILAIEARLSSVTGSSILAHSSRISVVVASPLSTV